jgi:glycosyltransferase involved in cell wall biosynthesis
VGRDRAGDEGHKPELSVVVMAFNEEASLAATCTEIASVLARLGAPSELLIINDGSADRTPAIAEDVARSLKGGRVVHHPANLGLGGVYRTGFAEARGRLVTFFPADGQFPASIIEEFLQHSREVDLVLGYLPRRTDAVVGRLFSVAQRLLYRALLGPMPRFQGIMLFRRELLSRVELVSRGRDWVVLMEFILRVARSGARVTSVPTDVRPRVHGASKVNNWRTIRSTMVQMLALRRALRAPESTPR